jgi:signal transduction histidine kinase
MKAFLAALRLILIAAGGLAVLVALLASWILARQMTRPLREIELASQAIAGGDLQRRVSASGQDEIASLAVSINQMAADLARLESARREFIAKISHDLRTPLTAIKGLIVNLMDEVPEAFVPNLEIVDSQTDRLTRLVDDLLTASRLQKGELRMQLAPTDLEVVVLSATALAAAKAERMGVSVHFELHERPTHVQGDADRLQQVVLNLTDNGLKATKAGGQLRICLSGGEEVVTVTVTDDGRGLADDEAARAFEPYYRSPEGGAGLGLTIAKEIVTAHQGRIWLEPRPEGGAEAGFSIPAWQPGKGSAPHPGS